MLGKSCFEINPAFLYIQPVFSGEHVITTVVQQQRFVLGCAGGRVARERKDQTSREKMVA